MLKRLIFAGLVVSCLASTLAQRGDRPGHQMKEVWREMEVPPAPALAPEEALQTFKLAEGFRMELVAAEPYVEDPVALAFDPEGRIWVVEMRGYMPNVDGTGEDARNGIVAVLEDQDRDGSVDHRTEFLTGLQMPRAIALVDDGALVAEPPNLWFCRDRDGDLKCDEKTLVLDHYGIQGPVEHTENGLMLGLDNWIYNAKSTKRIRFVNGQWKVQNNFFRGQWGITHDNYGRLYYNYNADPLYVDLVPASYIRQNEHFDTEAGLRRFAFRSREVWTGRVNPGINRGYQEDMLRDGRLAVFTAACGPAIYRGDAYPPSFVGQAVICEPGGNMVRLQTVEFSNGQVTGENAYEQGEWLTSTDERFRPVNAYSAPDGTVYIVDMYRGILQHKLYVTTFLRKQILDRNLDQPLGLGRIYRIVHESRKPGPPPRFSEETPDQWVRHLAHANGWWRDCAQRLLIEADDSSVVPNVRAMAVGGSSPLSRIHALWTLEGMQALDAATVLANLDHPHPQVRVTAIRLAEDLLRQEPSDEEEALRLQALLGPLLDLEQSSEIDVLRQLVLSLCRIERPEIETVLRRTVRIHGRDDVVREGLVAGLENRELEFLQRLIADPEWRIRQPHMTLLIESLAACVARQAHPYRVERLLDLALKQREKLLWRRTAILAGVVSVADPIRGRKARPIRFAEEPLPLARLRKQADPETAEQLQRLGSFIAFGAEAEPPPPPRPLSAREQALFADGELLFQLTCASCHLASGLGEEGKAPPLLDSPYLLGAPERLVRIVQNGLTGPVSVHGRVYDMTMPALQGFNDEQIAAILTYARRAWNHGAEPILPEKVRQIREAAVDRELPWTVEELEKATGGAKPLQSPGTATANH